MAQRRMIDRDIILQDKFMNMNNASKTLYICMLVSADDEGFFNNVRLFTRRRNALDELVANGYVHRFDSGVVLLLHWHVHNKLRKDTFKPSIYNAEKALVFLDSDRIYKLKSVTDPLQTRTETVPQVSIGKERQDQVSSDEVSQEKESQEKESQDKLTEGEVRKNTAEAVNACGGSLNLHIKSDFDIFWDRYPNKNNKPFAESAFENVDVPLETILEGLENHKNSRQWRSDGGAFIPLAGNWLMQKRWTDRMVPDTGVPRGASGELGEVELEMIRRTLAKGI